MESIQYKCPSCGGDLKFDPSSGKYACEFCRSIFSQEEMDRQTKAEEAKDAGKDTKKPEPETSEDFDAQVYTCPSCGAEIVTDGTTAATFCFYCHNPIVLKGRLDGAYKPDYVIPFKVSKEKAIGLFEDWIKKKKFVPKGFYSKDQIEKMTGVYFPYMLYRCNIAGNVKAQATRISTRIVGDMEYTDHDVYDVCREGNMEIKHVMRNALKKNDRVLAENILPFDSEEMKPFNMSYLSGFFAEKRDCGKEEFDSDVKQEVRDYAVARLKESVNVYSDLQITENNTRLENEKWEYALFPVWTLTYNDKKSGRIYYFSVNGQSGKTIGELPVDMGKLILNSILIALPVLVGLLAFFYFIL